MAGKSSFPPPTTQELRSVLTAVEKRNPTLARLFEMMVYTGLRFSDASKLNFELMMINGVPRKKVSVVQSKTNSKGLHRLSLYCEKHDYSDEEIKQLKDKIKKRSTVNLAISEQAAEIVKWCYEHAKGDRKLLFPNGRSRIEKPYSIRTANHVLNQVARELQLSYPLGTHSFRKSTAKMISEAGGTIYHVRDQLGHSSVQITDSYMKTFTSEHDEFAMKIKF